MKIVDWFMDKDTETIVSSLKEFPVHEKINEIVEYAKENRIQVEVRTKDDLLLCVWRPSLFGLPG